MLKFRRLRGTDHVARKEASRGPFKILTGKPAGKGPLGRPNHRWEDDFRMEIQEIVIIPRNWINSAQDMDY